MPFKLVNLINVNKVKLTYGNQLIFDNICLTIPRGKIISIIGPSGIGKTTLLRLISGQIFPDNGEIFFENKNILAMSRSCLYKIRQKMSMLFQSAALFNDMNVFDNVAYPLREHTKLPNQLLKTIVTMKLEVVGLRGSSKLMPLELSGGMKRRIALARAIILEPDLILLDEPFAGQDPINTKILVNLIRKINKILDITFVMVSHNINEVLNISDYIYILMNKKIIAQGDKNYLKNYQDPQVQQFLYGYNTEKSISLNFYSKNYYEDLLENMELNC